MSTELHLRPSQPEQMDGDMTPGDIADILARLRFSDNFQVIKIDRPARDYLLACVAARCGKA
jgi:hypothetical protein